MPYDLPSIATRSREFRTIEPNATLEADLLRLYTPILQKWRDSAAISVALYAQGADMEQQDDNTAKEIALLLLFLKFSEYFTKVETWHRSKWLASVKAATGVDATWMTSAPVMTSGRTATAYVEPVGGVVASAKAATANTARFAPNTFTNAPSRAYADPWNTLAGKTPVTAAVENATASARQLAKSLSDETQNRINQALAAGRRTGASATDVARDINTALAKGRKRAIGIAENELDNAVKGLTQARMSEAGLDFGKWHHTPQRNPRLNHRARNGNLYRASDPILNEMYLPNCKCSFVPVLKLGKFSGK